MLPPAAQQQSPAPAPQPSTHGQPDLQAAAPAPAVIPVPAEPVVGAPPVTLPSVPGTAAKPSAEAAVVATPPPAPQKKVSIRISAPAAVKQGEQFAAEIFAADADGLTSAPLTVVFDPAFIEVITVSEGELFKNDGKSATFTYKIDNKAGQVSVNLLRDAASGGVKGGGRLFTMNVRAKSPGPASIGFIGVKLQSQGGKQLDATLYNAVVEVRKP